MTKTRVIFRRCEIGVYAVVALLSAIVLASYVGDTKTGFLNSPHWFFAHLSFIALLVFLGDRALLSVRREAGRKLQFSGLMHLGCGILAFVFVCNIFAI